MKIPICIHGGNDWFKAVTKIFPSPVAGSGETPEEAVQSLIEVIKLNCWFYKSEITQKRISDDYLEQVCELIEDNWNDLSSILEQ